MEGEEMKSKLKRSCSLQDFNDEEANKLVKVGSLENIKTDEIESTPTDTQECMDGMNKEEESVKSVKTKTLHDVDINKINKIICNPEKCKLMQKALDLGLNIKSIVECLLETDYSDEEKFFEKLIESVVKSSEGQKGHNKDDSDLIETFVGQEGNPTENSEENKSQLDIQKQKKSSKLNSNLRPIIVDGIDVATSSNNQTFTVTRIKSVVEYFEERGHSVIVIVPEKEVQEHQYLSDLEKLKHQVCSPRSKKLFNKRIDCDVDALMLSLANKKDGDFQGGIIVSNNDFKKILLNDDGDKYKQIIEERVLMYSFVHDEFMPTPDPLGKNGPSLDNFLLFETVVNQKHCPYRKKCTYGTKCKFFHPERESKKQFKTAFESVNDEVQENRRLFENLKKNNIMNTENVFVSSNYPVTAEVSNLVQTKELSNKKNLNILANQPATFEKKRENQPPELKKQNLNAKILSHQSEHLSSKFFTPDLNCVSQLQHRSIGNKDTNQANQMTNAVNKVQNENILFNDSKTRSFERNDSFGKISSPNIIVSQKPKNSVLYEKLLSRLPEHKALKVLIAYPDETDEDKLVYFAKEDDLFEDS